MGGGGSEGGEVGVGVRGVRWGGGSEGSEVGGGGSEGSVAAVSCCQ